MSAPLSPKAETAFPLADADLCVKCGLCLPHCPTYQLTQHEADSPRGRIALMQGLSSGLIPVSDKLQQHLDGCLSCRSCESVCPAKVPYGRLIDAGRAMLRRENPRPEPAMRLVAFWLTKAGARRCAAALLWLYQRSGMQVLLRRARLLGRGPMARLDSLLPRVYWPRALRSTADTTTADVALFSGCTGELADRRTLEDALRLLSRFGIRANVPTAQGCCGALHQHSGQPAHAAKLAQVNVEAFAGDKPVISCASGCGATLMEYPELLGAAGAGFSGRVRVLNGYLLQHWPDRLSLKPLRARVAIHTPCTLRNVVKGETSVRSLVEKIPGVEIVALDQPERCCGAAGSYFITQAEMADRLLQPKLQNARALAPDFIISSNIGCSLHLAAGLRREGLTVEVLHPVSLLARQLA